jgi:predicted MFS family arabinose efflux permease
MISNFANNLVGAFIALIVFEYTGDMKYAIAYLVATEFLRICFTLLLKNLYGKYPQLFLLIRIIPLTLYNLFIFVLAYNPIIGVIGVGIFYALDLAMNGLSREIIFNYSSLTQKDGNSSIGITRLFEQIGKIVALIIGGYLLDFNKTLVLILSLSIYAISVIPLVLFYIKSRKQKTFNKDATSNALDTLTKNEELKKESKKLSKKLLITYFFVYFAFAFVDLLQTTFNLLIFYKQGEFATAGIISAVFNTFYAVGFYVAGKVNDKFDTTKLVIISCILIAICTIALPFIPLDRMFVLVCIVFGLIAFFYTFISLFVLDRMLLKSRIMGCSNKALFMRETGCVSAYIFGFSFGFIGGPITGLIAIFIISGIAMFSSSIVIPTCEEKTRQHLVDYLQNNEKMNNKSTTKSRAKRIASAQSKSK